MCLTLPIRVVVIVVSRFITRLAVTSAVPGVVFFTAFRWRRRSVWSRGLRRPASLLSLFTAGKPLTVYAAAPLENHMESPFGISVVQVEGRASQTPRPLRLHSGRRSGGFHPRHRQVSLNTCSSIFLLQQVSDLKSVCDHR